MKITPARRMKGTKARILGTMVESGGEKRQWRSDGAPFVPAASTHLRGDGLPIPISHIPYDSNPGR
jgi:hypothetical protein